jgi:uncharacterized protein YciI
MSTSAAPAFETVWLVEATYAPDAADTRGPFRAEHLARMQELIASGVVLEVGAFVDMSASVVMLRAPSEEAALELLRADVYLRNGVWVELRARALSRLIPSSDGG